MNLISVDVETLVLAINRVTHEISQRLSHFFAHSSASTSSCASTEKTVGNFWQRSRFRDPDIREKRDKFASTFYGSNLP